MQSVLAWDNIYDPSIRKVITPVSRIWSSEWFASEDFGGFTLFCWDTYFAAMMLAVGSKELAYANAVEITKAITECGFIPNCFYSNGFKSRDRSQPPVGSLVVWMLYKQYKEKWFLELLYKELLTWNRWWSKNREDKGLLCWEVTLMKRLLILDLNLIRIVIMELFWSRAWTIHLCMMEYLLISRNTYWSNRMWVYLHCM